MKRDAAVIPCVAFIITAALAVAIHFAIETTASAVPPSAPSAKDGLRRQAGRTHVRLP